MNNIDVSIVIVCMNNLKNLYPCLESIRKYTTISYETLVVAYLFNKDNLEKVKEDFPWVTFIESNEIRGFSENNNLALRQSKGKYCFVLNDDTYMDQPVIDKLVSSIEKQSDNVAIMSPKGLFPNGALQSCGRPIHTFWTTIASMFFLYKEQKTHSKYVNQHGIFETGTVVGAYFLIKTDVFRKIGFFNEMYFFCPEDIEVGAKIRTLGLKCYVNSDIYIFHTEGGSYKTSRTRIATMPSEAQGTLLYYGNNSIKRFILLILMKLEHFMKYLYWKRKIVNRWDKADIMATAHKNSFDSIGSKMTPKEIFCRYFLIKR